MGQQQLLLLILGVVIVAISIVVALDSFDDNRRKAAADELVTIGTRVAGEGATWVLQHPTFGGGGGSPSAIAFSSLGYEVGGDGLYYAGDSVFDLTADASSFVITGEAVVHQMYVAVAVYGPTVNCVVTITAADAAPATPAIPAGCSGW